MTGEPARWRFEAIGTAWEIETTRPLSVSARAAVSGVIERFDAEWSRFRDDSVVSRLARTGGDAPAPADATALLDAYAELAEATGGAVNPLVGRALERAGYDAEYSLADGGALAAPVAWRELVDWSGERLSIAAGQLLDVGAIGKGRLVDLVAAELDALLIDGLGVDAFTVDAGGDLVVRGAVQRVGLEHPYDPSRAIGVVEVADRALCASATNRRAWVSPVRGGLHHVLDARTGEPVRTIAATWALAPTAMQADAAATALFFDGGARFAHERGIEWVRMTTDGRVEWSPGSTAELFV